jgi:DeoR/GlpR family transcriptional regulator of sugar metabolism
MLAAQRRRRIQELLRERSSISVKELGELLGVSEMTIRRDLRLLDGQGALRRVHGGALADRSRSAEPPFPSRLPEQADQKRAIARCAAGLVRDGDCLALDVGTTTLELARLLICRRNLTVITASLHIAGLLAESPGIRLIVTGGEVRHGELSLTGHLACRALRSFRVDTAFIGIGGLDPEGGLTEYNLEDALVKQALIRHAARSVVVADSTKLGRTCFAAVAPVTRIHTLITDVLAPPEHVAALRERGLELMLAG